MAKKVSFPFDPVGDGWFNRTVKELGSDGFVVEYRCVDCDFSRVIAIGADMADDLLIDLENHASSGRFHEIHPKEKGNAMAGNAGMDSDKLTAIDYLTEPFQKLVRHPDYSPAAMDVAMRIAILTTEDLEGLDDIVGGK